MANPTPKLDDAIDRLGTPNLFTKTGFRVKKGRLHLKSYNGTTLQEAALRALLLADRDLAQKGNKSVQVISSYRSWAKQAALYAAWAARGFTGLPAAKPGHSMHNIGLAIDITNWSDPEIRNALAKHGWNWGSSFGDNVHFSYKVHG